MAQAQQQAVGIQQVLVAMQNQQNQFALQEKQLQLARRALERQIEALGDKDSAKADVAALKQRMQQNEQQQAALKAQQQAVEAQILQLMQAVAPQPAAVAAPAQAQKIVVGPEAAVREVVAREAAARRQVQQQADAVQLEVAIEALEIARAGGRPAINVGMPVSPPNTAAVEQEKIWTTAFDGALSAEQKKQLAAAAELRAAFQPKTPAERVVAEMDRLLILDARQRDQLVGLAEKVIASYGNNAAALRNPNLSATSLIAAVKSRLAGDALIGILSETQLAAWTSDLRRPTSPVLRQEGRQDILMPAVPAAPVEMLWQR
jgi:hypothetical protein